MPSKFPGELPPIYNRERKALDEICVTKNIEIVKCTAFLPMIVGNYNVKSEENGVNEISSKEVAQSAKENNMGRYSKR